MPIDLEWVEFDRDAIQREAERIERERETDNRPFVVVQFTARTIAAWVFEASGYASRVRIGVRKGRGHIFIGVFFGSSGHSVSEHALIETLVVERLPIYLLAEFDFGWVPST